MDCREMVLSEEVYDFITDFRFDRLNLQETLCHANIEDMYNIVYYDRQRLPDIESNFFYYQNVPKLYGLMQVQESRMSFDPNNLIASGITQVQRPPLRLTGQGVIMCVIDTGERVMIMSD